jgi:hypothetical protein
MFFIIKKSVNQVDFFVPDQYAFAVEYSPIEKASKFIPKWYKECPSSQENLRTVKGCVGVINTLTSGFIVPAWSEFKINWNSQEITWQNSDGMSIMSHHPKEQIPGFCDNYFAVKITSPWLAFFKKQTKVMFMPPIYYTGFDTPYKMVPGCQATATKHNMMLTNNFLFFEKRQNQQSILIEHRQPISHLVPLDDYEYKINCHVDTNKWNKLGSIMEGGITFVKTGIKRQMLDKSRSREGAK